MGRLLTNRGLLATAWFFVLAALAGGAILLLVQPPPPPSANPAVVTLDLPPAPPQRADGGAPPEPETAAEQTTASTGGGQAARSPQAEGVAPRAEAPAADVAAAEATPEGPPPAATAPPQAADAGAERGAAATTTEPPTDSEGASAEQPLTRIPVIPPAPEQLPYWERYRQPFNMDDKRPRIAVVMTGLGLSDSATEAAINKLPPAVTLSFSPYARELERWIAQARARGHEVMLDLPMEATTFPNEDPGPQGLLTSLDTGENLDRLDWVLSRGSAYVGLAGSMGSRFTASPEAIGPVLRDLKERGLIFLDRRTTEHSVVPQIAREIDLPHAVNSRSIDERQASRVAIDARLAQIERIALSEGYAVAMAQPYPVTLERLADWATELTARGFVIAPISALTDQDRAP